MTSNDNCSKSSLQFRLSALFALTLVTAVLVCFGPLAWRHAFAPNQDLPSQYYAASGDDLRYSPQGPEFKLSK